MGISYLNETFIPRSLRAYAATRKGQRRESRDCLKLASFCELDVTGLLTTRFAQKARLTPKSD